jgi:hypothetical protein
MFVSAFTVASRRGEPDVQHLQSGVQNMSDSNEQGINRREFLGAAGGFALAASGLLPPRRQKRARARTAVRWADGAGRIGEEEKSTSASGRTTSGRATTRRKGPDGSHGRNEALPFM